MSVPLDFSTGLASLVTSFEKIVSSKFFQVLAGIAGLVGFLASVATILQGWPAVKELIDNLKK